MVTGKVVILADGTFPSHPIPLRHLRNAGLKVCCDGSVRNLVNAGLTPDAIVGDMDSLPADLISRFSEIIFRDTGQETNDLTKAVYWCREKGISDIIILGATGKREDHTIGNISLLAEYSQFINVKMVTDTGEFTAHYKSFQIETFPGQQISIFSVDPETEITSGGLKFPLNKRKLRNWWEATLNEAIGNSAELELSGGPVIVFCEFTEG